MTVRPLADRDSLKKYYDDGYTSGRYLNRTKEYAVQLRRSTFKYWFNSIRHYIGEGGRFLDIGCGDGTAMMVAEELGFEVYGNDISEVASQNALQRWQNRVFSGLTVMDCNFAEGYFDCISMFDFLEHTVNPLDYLSYSNRLLKRGGHLIISTHDAGSFHRRIMGRWWSYLNPDEHMHYFNQKALTMFLKKTNFEPLHIRNVFKITNLEFLLNEFQFTNRFFYNILRGMKMIMPAILWNLKFSFNPGEILCVARKS